MSNFSSANQERQKLLSIIQNAATTQRKETQGFVDSFLKNKQTGIYNYLKNIPNEYVFYYTVIFFVVYFFLRGQKFVYQDIIILIISLICIYLLNEARRTLYISRMEELKIKLNSIFPKPKYFYMDSGIIEIIHSMKEFKAYNILAFNNLINMLDTFLGIIRDIEKDNSQACSLYLNLIDFRKSILNNTQSFIYKIPSNLVIENKLTDITDNLHLILNYHMENVRLLCNKNNDKNITINSKFLKPNHIPNGKDPRSDDRFDLF